MSRRQGRRCRQGECGRTTDKIAALAQTAPSARQSECKNESNSSNHRTSSDLTKPYSVWGSIMATPCESFHCVHFGESTATFCPLNLMGVRLRAETRPRRSQIRASFYIRSTDRQCSGDARAVVCAHSPALMGSATKSYSRNWLPSRYSPQRSSWTDRA